MAKSTKLEQELARLRELDLASPNALAELRHALSSKTNLVVAKAAQLAAKAALSALAPDLEASFDRFMVDSGSTDKGCTAKAAIAQALYEFGQGAQAVFLAGIHHVQREPAFGGSSDTAAELRGICAMGLVRMAYRDVMTELAELLMDKEPQARIMAARALAYSERDEGALLLRLKILAGDAETDVTGECFTAILKLAPRRSLALVERFLDAPDGDLAQLAAVAIGSSKLAEAFEVLRARWDRSMDPDVRERLLVPLALLRRPEAIDMLVELVGRAPVLLAAGAAKALGMYRHDDGIRSRVIAIAQERNDPDVSQAVAKVFGR